MYRLYFNETRKISYECITAIWRGVLCVRGDSVGMQSIRMLCTCRIYKIYDIYTRPRNIYAYSRIHVHLFERYKLTYLSFGSAHTHTRNGTASKQQENHRICSYIEIRELRELTITLKLKRVIVCVCGKRGWICMVCTAARESPTRATHTRLVRELFVSNIQQSLCSILLLCIIEPIQYCKCKTYHTHAARTHTNTLGAHECVSSDAREQCQKWELLWHHVLCCQPPRQHRAQKCWKGICGAHLLASLHHTNTPDIHNRSNDCLKDII